MATPVTRIEKEFYLQTLFTAQIPVVYIYGQTQYFLYMVQKPTKGQLFFKSDRPIEGLMIHKNINLIFDYYGEVIIFAVEIVDIKETYIITFEPEFLQKNLARSFQRVSPPADLQVLFTFKGDHYSLPYPRIHNYEDEAPTELIDTMNPKDLKGIFSQITAWGENIASGIKIMVFQNTKLSCTEERLLAETGRSVYLPSTLDTFPRQDPYPKRRLITEDMFKRYLESVGVDIHSINKAYADFIKEKNKNGIFSDLWVPIFFQEYVVGYIHIWVQNKEGAKPLDYGIIDSLYQFTKVLAVSLKTNGIFDRGKMKNEPLMVRVIDISASGLLFTYPDLAYAKKLLPETELSVQLKTDHRTINTPVRIARQYKDGVQMNYGCRFLDMEPEDLRFLFEYIYGKTFSAEEKAFFAGRV
jgi:hypothetical protein